MSKGFVYIIDDEFDIRYTLESIFRFSGFTVHSFDSAESALGAKLAEKDACIILDLNMPGMGGLQFQEALRAQGIRIPIIVYSGHVDVKTAVTAMADGAFTLLEKPVSSAKLVESVENAIQTHKNADLHLEQCEQAKALLDKLSKRELEIAKLISDGFSAGDVAEKLFISRRTVEAHRASIFTKLKIKSVAILAQWVLLAFLTDN